MAPKMNLYVVEYRLPTGEVKSGTVLDTSHENAADKVRKSYPDAMIIQSIKKEKMRGEL